MRINTSIPTTANLLHVNPADPKPPADHAGKNSEYRKAFDSFVGEVFFGQMLRSMRNTVGRPAYFHGGRAEEIFRQQLDQVLAEKLSNTCADKFSGPMFELMNLGRK